MQKDNKDFEFCINLALNNAKKMLQKTYSLTKTEILKNKVIIN